MCIARRPLCIIGATIDAIMAGFIMDRTTDTDGITAITVTVTGVTDPAFRRSSRFQP